MADQQPPPQQQPPTIPPVERLTETLQGLTITPSSAHHHQRQYPLPEYLSTATPVPPPPASAPPQPPMWRPVGTFPAGPVGVPPPAQQLPQTASAPGPSAAATTAAAAPAAAAPRRQKIDPNQMPNPTTTSSGETAWGTTETFPTRGAAAVANLPPPSTKPGVSVRDCGSAPPRYLRMTTYVVPASSDAASGVSVPVAAVVAPLADDGAAGEDERPPLVDAGAEGPVRCHRCRAYISPFAAFSSGGKQYQCRLCGLRNDVPDFYFSPLEPDGRRADIAARPELTRGSVEYSVSTCPDYAPSDGRVPAAPALCFVLDISDQSVSSGALSLVVGCLRQLLLTPSSSPATSLRVGFVTYNGGAVHFWDLSSSPPRMLAVPDVEAVFVPSSARGLFVDCQASDTRPAVEFLLEKLVTVAQQQLPAHRLAPPALGAAIQAAAIALRSRGLCGKAIVFHSSMPAGAPGVLRDRDAPQIHGTEKEKTLLVPQTAWFRTVAQQCATARVGVDVFLLSPREYVDVATIGDVCRLTGGQLYHHHRFDVAKDAWKVESELRRNLIRGFGHDALLRVRVSMGLSVTEYLGHFFPAASATADGLLLDIDLPTIDADKAVAAIIKHDERFSEGREVIVQAALLYTTMTGDRRVRVHTVCVPASAQYPTIFKALDCDAIVGVLARVVTQQLRQGVSVASVSAAVVDQAIDCLAAYRRWCTTSASQGQLILPEAVRLLPLFVLSMTKIALLRSDAKADLRAAAMLSFESEPVFASLSRLYPRAFALHPLFSTSVDPLPPPSLTRLGLDWITPSGVFLVDDGTRVHVWVGAGASPEILTALFGTPTALTTMSPPALTQAFSTTVLQASGISTPVTAVTALVGAIAQLHGHSHFSVNVSTQSDSAGETQLVWQLQIEDKQADAMSYVDFLCHIHRQIQIKLS